MIITMDVPASIYKHLARIAEEEYGDSSPQTIGLLLSENLNEVFDRSLKRRFQDKNVSAEKAIAIMRKHGAGKEPEEYDRL
ncbi:MAG: hypothetical protein EAZ92_10445 [Candidatus Kapaibacterium sp.]|nr:MAG: hypothetical protein EAZ92_10445 [Candidatus Kapabacteria bacterium]